MAGRLGEIPDETKELVELQRYHPTLHIDIQAVPKIVQNQNQNVRRKPYCMCMWGSHSQVPRLMDHSGSGTLNRGEATAALDLC